MYILTNTEVGRTFQTPSALLITSGTSFRLPGSFGSKFDSLKSRHTKNIQFIPSLLISEVKSVSFLYYKGQGKRFDSLVDKDVLILTIN